MKVDFDRGRLQLSLFVWRHGLIWLVAAALLALATLAWVALAMPARNAMTQATEALGAAMGEQRAAGAGDRKGPRLNGGTELGASAEATLIDHLGIWTTQAVAREVQWVAGDYREEVAAKTGQRLSRVELHLTGSYPNLRRLLTDLLRDTPQATVDRLAFTSDGVDGVVTAKVALTVWHKHQGTMAPSAPQAAATRGRS